MSTQATSPTQDIKFGFEHNEQRENQLRPLCEDVLAEFPPLPVRLCCYVAMGEDAELERQNGRHFRGFYTAFPNAKLPSYLINFSCDAHSDTAYNHLIYIRNSTCSDTTGFVLTFAHELQHLFQYCCAHKLWAANSILYHEMKDKLDPYSKLMAIDIPHEQEANIVSKRVAESICGPEAVRRFADGQIARFASLMTGVLDDPADEARQRWEFFRDLEVSIPFDLLEATKPLTATYKEQILAHRLGEAYGIDFTKEEWWK